MLVLALYLAVIVDLPASWQYWQLGAVYDISDAACGFIAVFLLDGLIIVHLALEVAEVLSDLLIRKNRLLIVGFLDFLSKDHVCTIALFQSSLHLLYNVNLLLLHILDAFRQGCGLPLVVIHALV